MVSIKEKHFIHSSKNSSQAMFALVWNLLIPELCKRGDNLLDQLILKTLKLKPQDLYELCSEQMALRMQFMEVIHNSQPQEKVISFSEELTPLE